MGKVGRLETTRNLSTFSNSHFSSREICFIKISNLVSVRSCSHQLATLHGQERMSHYSLTIEMDLMANEGTIERLS